MSFNVDLPIEGSKTPIADVQSAPPLSSPPSKALASADHAEKVALPAISHLEQVSYNAPSIAERREEASALRLSKDQHSPESVSKAGEPEPLAVHEDAPEEDEDFEADMSPEEMAELEAMLAAEEIELSKVAEKSDKVSEKSDKLDTDDASDKSQVTEAGQDKMEARQDKMQAVQVKGQETQKKAGADVLESVGELEKAATAQPIHNFRVQVDKMFDSILSFDLGTQSLAPMSRPQNSEDAARRQALFAEKRLVFVGPDGKLNAQSKEVEEIIRSRYKIGDTIPYQKAYGTIGHHVIGEIGTMTEAEQKEFEIAFTRLMLISSRLFNKVPQKEENKEDKKVDEKSKTATNAPLRSSSFVVQTVKKDDASVTDFFVRGQINIEKRIIDAERQRYERFYETQHQKNAEKIDKKKEINKEDALKEDIAEATTQEAEKVFGVLETEQKQATRHHVSKLDIHHTNANEVLTQ